MELIGSTEFGDWLLAELSDASRRAGSMDAGLSQAAKRRLNKLEVAKKLLLEFMILQQAMLEVAGEALELGKFRER